ncbi:MAG: Rne/Rng family ribonuclease [Proteobacteria bacterium]|nr:Rne/Rng family ribonuclease [Pseudomonadota bacterium]
MSNILVINTTSHETRVALVENGSISEFFLERSYERGTAGNIYKGRVLRVLPGMQAAFVDIGQEKAAFLYVYDVYNKHEAYMQEVDADAVDDPEIPQSRGQNRPIGPIEECLHQGQEILVQVAKEAIGTKGARITSHISLPGRFLVHMPTFDHIGVSRRISTEAERTRLRDLVNERRQAGTGIIVRTASEGATEQQIDDDFKYLTNLWRDILGDFERQSAPALLYEELDLPLRAVRDLLTDGIDEVIVDNAEQYERIREFVSKFIPDHVEHVKRYQGLDPIFDAYGIEIEISRALARKVWLRSGGYLVIDTAEALTAIDVNSGKFVGQHSLEDTILQINLEAAREIAYQLKIRNIGGIVIIDFIDMERVANREKVYAVLEEQLSHDKAKTNILKISEFGLVEMTRKRVRESLIQSVCEPCFYCEGKGYIRSRQSVAYEILRELQREATLGKSHKLTVMAHPDVAQLLFDEERCAIEALEATLHRAIEVHANPQLHHEQFEVYDD